MAKFNLLSHITMVYLLFAFWGCEKESIEPTSNTTSPPNSADSIYEINRQAATVRVLTVYKGNLGGKEAGWYDRFLITHISDTHVSYESPDNYVGTDKSKSCKNLKEAIRFSNQFKADGKTPLLGINCIVATGDLIGSMPEDTKNSFLNRLDYLMEFFNENNRIPSLTCTGNHDGGFIAKDTSNYLTKEDINKHVTKKINTPINAPEGENYFYKDIPNPMGGFIRFISLDVLDQTGVVYNTQSYATYSQKQIDWLCNTALKEGMTSGHSVIILNHFPYYSIEFKEKTKGPTTATYTHNLHMIPEIVEAFRKKESLVKSYQTIPLYADNPLAGEISVDADFSAIPGEFICYLGGHVHASVYFKLTGYANESPDLKPQLMILCTNQAASNMIATYNKVYREVGTITSDAFQIYAVDTKEGNIYMTYFGPYIPVDDPQKPEIEKIAYR